MINLQQLVDSILTSMIKHKINGGEIVPSVLVFHKNFEAELIDVELNDKFAAQFKQYAKRAGVVCSVFSAEMWVLKTNEIPTESIRNDPQRLETIIVSGELEAETVLSCAQINRKIPLDETSDIISIERCAPFGSGVFCSRWYIFDHKKKLN